MTSEIIHRVAKAIWVLRNNTPEQRARAAIEAMREPTDAMAAVYRDAWVESDFDPTPEDVWKAMINEALK